MDILDHDQHMALSFVNFANRGGHRPNEQELLEWMKSPQPKPAQKGPLLKAAKPAKYRYVGGVFDASEYLSDEFKKSLTNLPPVSAFLSHDLKKSLASLSSVGALAANALGTRELVEPEVPAEYGPDTPAESFVQHLKRLGWVDTDDRGGLGVTPLGRALLRSEDAVEREPDTYDVVVLDAENELSYPILVQRLAECGDAILIDPYLRVEQLLAIRAYTSISRVLISAKLKSEDRVAMSVLVKSGSDRPMELRMADAGVLHDRMVLGDSFALTLGTSMNTVGRQHPTILTPLPDVAADAMRVHAEKWWDNSEILAAYPAEEEPESDEDHE